MHPAPPSRRILLAVTVIAVAAFSSLRCSSSEDETGSAGGAPATGGAPGTCEPTAESISQTIFIPKCSNASCHGGDNPAAALDLSDPGVARALVGVSAGTCADWTRVVSGSEQDSLLWHKIYSTAPPCGEPMPPVGEPLTAVELDCVREWIRSGPTVDAGPGCETCGTAACVDLSVDTTNCGNCGVACPAGSACLDGTCECATGLEFCGGRCVDVQSNLAHCGACDSACPTGAVCNVGQCLCTGGLSACGDACVDTQSNATHCGACGAACGASQVCLRGACSNGCETLTQCGAACVDTTTSTLNCGVCDLACPSGASCIGGACQCPSGTSACGGACINTTSDPENCGACGNACGGGLVCEGGSCLCPGGGTACGTSCVDVATDPRNCGGCGNVCGAGQTCEIGVCTCSDATVSLSADVQPIFSASCATLGCHSGIRPQENLSLETGKSHGALVGVPSRQCTSRLRVAPGDPANSYVMNKLMNVSICVGSQMPKIGVSLPQQSLETIGAWICNGALDN